MSKTPHRAPFTLEDLRDLLDKHGRVTVTMLEKTLPDWTRKDIVARMATWRGRRCITFEKNGDDYEDLEILRIGRTKVEKTQTKGELLRAWIYYGVVERELAIAKDTSSNKNQIQKADDLIAKHISRIPTELLEAFVDDLPEELAELLDNKKGL